MSLAEDDELQGGLPNAVRRFNSIVRHLENSEILPRGLFQLLQEEEGALTFHQVGVESRMLSGYLEEIIDEEEEAHGKPDFGPVIALAPFLDQSDLKALIQSHLSGRGFAAPAVPEAEAGQNGPSLKSLVGLAPHMNGKDLGELVEACLAREPLTDASVLVALAPHMDSNDLGRLIRQNAPQWFNARAAQNPAPGGDMGPAAQNPVRGGGTGQAPSPRQDPTSEPDFGER